MRWLDLSMPLRPGMPAFPGDPEFTCERLGSASATEGYAVSRLALGSHAGTHVDPPRHFVPGGVAVDHLDLDALMGPCWVAEVDPGRSRIERDDVDGVPPGAERLLFRTRNSRRWAEGAAFFPDFVALSDGAADALLARNVRLVGVDALSVESDMTGAYPIHRRLLARGMVLLEGLLLDGVRAGRYDLYCLPLRLVDGDGGPARAVLAARE